ASSRGFHGRSFPLTWVPVPIPVPIYIVAMFYFSTRERPPSLDELDLSAPRQRSRDRRRPQVAEDPRVLLPPGGTIKLEDDFYLRREADEHIEKIAKLRGQTLVIKAPRQMGKSSLLIRYLAACKAADKQFAFIDFQSFSEADLSQLSTLTRRIAQILLRALKRKEDK